MTKTYKIPITWQTIKTYSVEADTLQEAVEKALKIFFDEPSNDGMYLEDSFEIDGMVDDIYPDEDYDIHEILKNV